MKKNAFLISLSLLTFNFGCFKSNEGLSTFQVTTETDICYTGDIGYLQLNEGEMHNQLVSLMIDNWSICSTDADEIANEIKRIINNKGYDIAEDQNLDFNEFKAIVNSLDLSSLLYTLNAANFNFEEAIDGQSFSLLLKAKMKGLVDLMEEMNYNKEVSIIQSDICNYYNQEKTGLNQDDLIYFGIMTDILIHSTGLWLASELGGQNKYIEFQSVLNNICGGAVQERGFWSKIILADAFGAIASAGSSLISSGGATALPNPLLGGIPTAGVIAVVGGASASISKAM